MPKPPTYDQRTATALKLYVVLARATRAVEGHIAPGIAEQGLTPAEFGALEALWHKGPMLLGELQRRILVSSGGITFLVDRLVAKGLVERSTSPEDRRARYAALTREGEKLIARIFPRHAEAIAEAVGGLTQAEQRDAIRLLRTLGLAAAGG